MTITFNPGYIGPNPPCCDTDQPSAVCGPCPGTQPPGGCGGCSQAPENTQSPTPQECKACKVPPNPCNNAESARCSQNVAPPAACAQPDEGCP